MAAMNELDREMELADRAEKRDDAMQRRQMLQKQKQAKAPARKVQPSLGLRQHAHPAVLLSQMGGRHQSDRCASDILLWQ